MGVEPLLHLLALARYVEPAQELSGPSHKGGGHSSLTVMQLQ